MGVREEIIAFGCFLMFGVILIAWGLYRIRSRRQ